MKYEDLKSGDVFNIENTPSYPKLKLEGGYVDMRDKIVNKTGDTVKSREVILMSVTDIAKQFDETEGASQEWIDGAKSNFLK